MKKYIYEIITVQDLLESDFYGSDSFFLPFLYEKNDNSHILNLREDLPVVVNDSSLRNSIFKQTEIILPTRKDIQENRLEEYGLPQNTKLLGVGGFLWILQNNNYSMYTQERTDTWKITTASGLVSEDPEKDLWREIAEETGILLKGENNTLKLISFVPEKHSNHLDSFFFKKLSMIKNEQLDEIRKQLPEEFSDYKIELQDNYPIKHTASSKHKYQNIHINMMNKYSYDISAIVHNNYNNNNINLTYELETHIDENIDILTADPEGYGRKIQLRTQNDLKRQSDNLTCFVQSYANSFAQ